MKKYTLITGASSGIGQAFAEHFAKKGHHLVLVARSTDKLAALKNTLQKAFKIDIQILTYDLSLESVPTNIFNELKNKNITVNQLINCAGVATNGYVSDRSLEVQHSQIMLNVTSLFDLTKLFLDDMLKQNEGTIINIASTTAYHPIPTMAVYAATKAFVLSFTEALSIECQGTNVQVLAISPGATDTNFFSEGAGVSVGSKRSTDDVINTTIKALNQKKISKIDGFGNFINSSIVPRLLTRSGMVQVVYGIMKKTLNK